MSGGDGKRWSRKQGSLALACDPQLTQFKCTYLLPLSPLAACHPNVYTVSDRGVTHKALKRTGHGHELSGLAFLCEEVNMLIIKLPLKTSRSSPGKRCAEGMGSWP